MPPPSITRLSHLHLPNPISYAHSLRLQEAVLNKHWRYRDTLRTHTSSSTTPPPSLRPPPPTLLSFSTKPTYTVGRRHLTTHPLSPSQIAFLTGTPTTSKPTAAATFHPSPRGGLLTYHAPGQLTLYPLIDLRQFSLSARSYISLLEDTVIHTCTALGVPSVGRSCGDPGVWILQKDGTASDRKICAVGVRVTRGVGSHGLGLNVYDAKIPDGLREKYVFQDPQGRPLPAAAGEGEGVDKRGYLSWGFGRIVACGLEGKRTTWLTNEGADGEVRLEEVASVFAGELVRALNQAGSQDGATRDGRVELEGVQEIEEGDVLDDNDDGTSGI